MSNNKKPVIYKNDVGSSIVATKNYWDLEVIDWISYVQFILNFWINVLNRLLNEDMKPKVVQASLLFPRLEVNDYLRWKIE